MSRGTNGFVLEAASKEDSEGMGSEKSGGDVRGALDALLEALDQTEATTAGSREATVIKLSDALATAKAAGLRRTAAQLRPILVDVIAGPPQVGPVPRELLGGAVGRKGA